MEKISATDFIKLIKGEYFETDSPYNEFYESDDQSKITEIVIRDITLEESIVLDEKWDYKYSINLVRCLIHSLNIDNGAFRQLNLFNCTYGDIQFDGGYFKELSISEGICKGSLSFRGGFYQKLIFDKLNIDRLIIWSGCYKQIIFYDATKIGEISITTSQSISRGKACFIDRLDLGLFARGNVNLILSEVTCNKLLLYGRYDESKRIIISKSSFFVIELNNFENKGHLLMNNVRSLLKPNKFDDVINVDTDHKMMPPIESLPSKPVFLITDSYLGTFEFKNVNLNSFRNIEIVDSDLSGLKYFNTIFPIKKITGNSHSLYETFNDLYAVAKTQNNKRDQVEYYKASQQKLLQSLLSKEKRIVKLPSIISLLIAKLYSDFGTKWLQAAILTLLLGFIFYFLMLLGNLEKLTSESFSTHYIQYLNPTHKITFMDKLVNKWRPSNSFYFAFFDLLGRIFIGIGIFETIRSFRKYVRS